MMPRQLIHILKVASEADEQSQYSCHASAEENDGVD